MTKYPIKKFVAPTNLVSEPQGTIYSVDQEESGESIYVQVSDNPKLPHWTRFGNLLETVFTPYCSDENFMDEIFRLYKQESTNVTKLLNMTKKKS